jgi:hypothetical protein
MSKEAMTLALEAAYLAGFNASGEGYNGECPFEYKNKNPEHDAVWCKDRDNALQEALAKQEQGEPVAWMVWGDNNVPSLTFTKPADKYVFDALYTTPQPAQKPWVGLTDEEIVSLVNETNARIGTSFMMAFARTTEAKLKEKNT